MLSRRMDATPGLKVTLLDIQRKRGDTMAADQLTRIIHKVSTAAWEFPAPTALRSVGLLDVLHEYASGGLGRKPCQNGPSPASLRKLMNNPG